MPISEVDGCGEGHWSDVLSILTESIEAAGFEGDLVSNADDVGIIHKRIIQNLYSNEMIICDVSGKNPNVMFELGMRLAFDKPTIIVKDDVTAYSFDTSSIEHLEYPRDLRFSKIVEFKQRLSDKLEATYKKSEKDPTYTTFLKHFGEFKVAKLDTKEVSGQEYILEELRSLRRTIRRLDLGALEGRGFRSQFYLKGGKRVPARGESICMRDMSHMIEEISVNLQGVDGILEVSVRDIGDHSHVDYLATEDVDRDRVDMIRRHARNQKTFRPPVKRARTKTEG